MGTLFLSCVCDSIVAKIPCACDSLLAKSCESGCRSMTVIHQAGTNCQDVHIVLYICLAVVIVALIAAWTVCAWKNKEIVAKEKEREAQKEKEKEESKRKQIADCQGKLIDFLEKQVKSFDIQKDEYGKATENFRECLESIANDKDQKDNSSKQLLISYLAEQIKKFDRQKREYDEACNRYKEELKDLIKTMSSNSNEGEKV